MSNFIFKVITKIIADRLSLLAPKLVSPSQFGFIKGRHIEDCIVAASECFNLLNYKCFGGIIALKVDIRKAFDSMDWGFIHSILLSFGFLSHFYDWISAILQFAKLLILLNGSPKGVVKVTPSYLFYFVWQRNI